jgi:hypothetical protein
MFKVETIEYKYATKKDVAKIQEIKTFFKDTCLVHDKNIIH